MWGKLSRKPITATLLANDRSAAETVYFMYEGMTLLDLPFEQLSWAASINQFPVELYLAFPNKRFLGRYLREIGQVHGVKILCSYFDGEG